VLGFLQGDVGSPPVPTKLVELSLYPSCVAGNSELHSCASTDNAVGRDRNRETVLVTLKGFPFGLLLKRGITGVSERDQAPRLATLQDHRTTGEAFVRGEVIVGAHVLAGRLGSWPQCELRLARESRDRRNSSPRPHE
jgi:hypothetical protein